MKNTMKKILLGIMLLITVIGLTGCTSEENNKEDDLSGLAVVNREQKENYSTYLDSSKVCFDYPSAWISLRIK